MLGETVGAPRGSQEGTMMSMSRPRCWRPCCPLASLALC